MLAEELRMKRVLDFILQKRTKDDQILFFGAMQFWRKIRAMILMLSSRSAFSAFPVRFFDFFSL